MAVSRAGETGVRVAREEFVDESEKNVEDIVETVKVHGNENIEKGAVKEVGVEESKNIVDINGTEKIKEDAVKSEEVYEIEKLAEDFVKAEDTDDREKIVENLEKKVQVHEREMLLEEFVKVEDANDSETIVVEYVKEVERNGSEKIVESIVKAEDKIVEDLLKKVNEIEQFLEEFEEEVEIKEHGQRTQVFFVVLVVAVYLLCQAAVIFVSTSERFWAPIMGYSDDIVLFANSTDHGEKHRVGMETVCSRGGEGSYSPRNVSWAQEKDLESLVFNAVRDRVNISADEDATCVVTVYYYLCGSGTNVVGGKYRLEKGKFIDIHDDDSSAAGDTEFTTFLDTHSGQSVAISISYATEKNGEEFQLGLESDDNEEEAFKDLNKEEEEGINKRKKESEVEFGIELAAAITCLKLLIPVPIAAALLVYLGLPALRRRRQGKIILCKLSSELVISSSPWTGRAPAAVFASSFSIVAGLTWTTVLCYDLWRSCGDGGLRRASRDRSCDRRKFLRYSAVGWGHAALSGGVAVLCEQQRHHYSALMAVMFVVYFFLNLLNLTFFAFTVAHVRRHNARVLSLIRRGRRGPKAAHGPYFYFRITVLTGILTFFFELFDICALGSVVSDDVGGCRYFVILGLSLLDKTLYFVILVCNSRVFGLLKKSCMTRPIS